MATYKFYLVSLCLMGLMCISNAEVVKTHACEPNPGNCHVDEVRVIPCPESNEGKPCKVKRGKSATIQFDATPQWEANTTYAMVYSVTDEGDLPMVGMNTNACEHIQCPIQKEIKQTYAYTLPLSKKFPLNTYTIRWVLRDASKSEDTADRCCFTTKIKLIK